MYKLITALFMLQASLATAANYELDKSHTAANFDIAHMVISTVNGHFSEIDGKFAFDESSNKFSNLKIIVGAASINTNDEKRDKHLRSGDFFDVKKFPNIIFKLKEAKVIKGKAVQIKGQFTMLGKELPIKGTLKYKGSIDAYGVDVAAFQLEGTIKRKDWGLTWNDTLDSGAILIGDDVEISVEIQAKKVK